ncbi:MAG: Protein translocase subunit SecY [Parcubacteria group bacterium GW2011_GWA2_47_8b]|uniref:Protein translocase subunit SecY n=1 Tax=Candidatus Giovannonibacteria bacterium GW2011_GWB1_47_6b TaxID=1618655 RepID=A0A0G1T4N5_9BACT|nr:MAG: Protein translocase subunit SecY [Candidatus Giovannonibacteria bacterium GW2011_GWB1_47_6b]KKU85303.1 MAG: Protein translocase subunit SecY [Parcubacteria group bacterium GW2011_GWA2_47_8b]
MTNKILQIFKIPDLRRKIFFVLLGLVAFRILANIPIPGIDSVRLSQLLNSNQILGFLNIFSGGGLSNLSIALLGVGPYITATIIMQLLTMIFPSIKAIYYEEGAAGRVKFNRYSRYLTVPLAALQGYGFLNLLTSQGVLGQLSTGGLLLNVLIVTAGTMVLTWIGELITEQKIGNGVSLIIFAGIVGSLPVAIRNAIVNFNPAQVTSYIAFAVLSVVIIAGVVFMNQGERRVPVSYAKRIRGNRVYGGVASYLPLKINQAGVIPIIFAISIMLFPQFFGQLIAIFSPDLSVSVQNSVNQLLNNQVLYSIIYFALVVMFTYFYTAITFNPKEIAKNLQQSGGFIPGIRPGEPSGEFLSKLTHRITLFGAIFLGLIAILPNITQLLTGVATLTIGGTALLIVVSVALETVKQLDSELTLREYEGLK